MRYLLITFLIITTGCASYMKRRACDNINWYNLGVEIAMRGEWINSDKTVQECRQVEANVQESQLDLGFKSGMKRYCDPDNAYKMGKAGDIFNKQLCEGPDLSRILKGHAKGVEDYCAKDNAEYAGSSGKKYLGVCSPALEKNFLPGYRKGRKKYVEQMIAVKTSESQNLRSEISMAQVQLAQYQGNLGPLRNELNSLEAQKSFLSSQGQPPGNNSSMYGNIESRISYVNGEVNRVNSMILSQESLVQSLSARKKQIDAEIADLKQELPSLSSK